MGEWGQAALTVPPSTDSLPHQLLLSWFIPSLVGQNSQVSCDSHMAYITSRSRFLGTVNW